VRLPWFPGPARVPVAPALALAGAALLPSTALAQDDAPGSVPDPSRIEALEQQQTELQRRIDLVAEEIERMKLGEVAVQADQSRYGLGPAASKVYSVVDGLSIGGYGELLYQNYDSERQDGTSSGQSDELDFLRAILYVGYKFNDRWVLNTEIEWEHASTSEDGSVSVEFAYLDYLHSPAFNLRVGAVLIPMGFLNELHEPTTFYSARRPGTETRIIPSTWRENGIGAFGDVGPISYRAYVVNGLDATGFSASGLRGGRQKASQALVEDIAFVARVDWTDTPGLLVGVSAYHGDSGQNQENTPVAMGPTFDVPSATTTIVEGHVEYRYRGARLRALLVKAQVDDAAELNTALGLTGTDSVGEELEGGYVEVGYDVLAATAPESGQSFTPFVRWETYDTQADVPAGFAADPSNDVDILTFGVAYFPIPNIVFKADYQDVDDDGRTGVDQFNLAMGYIF